MSLHWILLPAHTITLWLPCQIRTAHPINGQCFPSLKREVASFQGGKPSCNELKHERSSLRSETRAESAPQDPRFYACDAGGSGTRNRREHFDLQPRLRRADAAASLQ